MDLSKEARFVARVLRQTQTKELKWERISPPKTLWVGTDSKIFDFYSADVGAGKVLGIYEVRSPFYDDHENLYWQPEIALALFDSQMNHEYSFRISGPTRDLFNEVKREVAQVDQFLDSFLGEE